MTQAFALRFGLSAAVLLAVAAIPYLFGSFTVSLFNDIGMATLVVLGLVLLSGVGGVISFGQAAFVGIAAYASAWLNTQYAISPWIGLGFAVLITALSALAIGFMTLRLGGHYLPLSTIAWGVSVPLLFGNMSMLGRHSGISGVAPLKILDVPLLSPESSFYVIWVLVGLVAVFSHRLLNSRMGRVIRAIRGGQILTASFGANIFHVRLTLFVLAAVLAALAGWLYAHVNRFVSPAPFSLPASIDYVFMMVVGSVNLLMGAVAGATIVLILRNALQDILPWFSDHPAQIQAVVFAVIFILLLHYARGGVMRLFAFTARRFTVASLKPAGGPGAVAPLPRRELPCKGELVLSVRGATKRFKGLVAVDAVGFDVEAGEILGLIGPNGAGKSTMFNLLTGTQQLSSGHVEFLGRDITGMSQQRVALLGMARTFQHVKLRPQMSVLENVALGAHARGRCGYLRGGFNLNGDEERRIFAEARRQIERIGLSAHERDTAGSMPLGSQRLIEIARALAADPVLLILDEPAAGLRKGEKRTLAQLLGRLRDEGVTIVIVEHDMDFVMKLVDRLLVMNFGTKLFDGSPQAARANKSVRAAYLGDAA